MIDRKTSILFVDDEVDVLAGLRTTLHRERRRFDFRFESDSARALEDLTADPVDIVVSDMRMPALDGASFLERVHDQSPHTIRLALSGQADQEQIMRALPFVHQWLAKPCPRRQLLEVLERAESVSRLVTDPAMMDAVGEVTHLPSVPEHYAALQAVLANPSSVVEGVTDIVEADPASAAKLLQVVNSAFFGQPRVISSVREAVMVLGTELVASLVLSTRIFEAFDLSEAPPGFDFHAFSNDASSCAALAGAIMTDCGEGRSAAQASTAGVLHDLGLLVLLRSAPELLSSTIELARAEGISWHEAERRQAEEQSGSCVGHASIGAALLASWGLPLQVIEAVALHHEEPAAAPEGIDVAFAVQLANRLLDDLPSREGGRPFDPEPWRGYLRPVGAAHLLDAWQAKARRLTTGVRRSA